jgi:hypothetical protein
MELFSKAARKELETSKDVRNEFAHRVARSFSFERIRDLANNLSLSERVEFHLSVTTLEGGRPGICGLVRSLQPIRYRPPYCLRLHQTNSPRENAIFVRVSPSAEHFFLSAKVRRFIIFQA